MDAVLNDSALLLLTYDDTKSLRVRIKTLSKKYVAPIASEATPGEILMSPNHTSDEAICEQFGKIRPHSNLLDAILIPEAPQELNITTDGGAAGTGGGAGAGTEENESEIDSIQIDYSSNLVLCSSQTNLNDILRETNQKYDKKLLKTMKRDEASKKQQQKMSSFGSEEEGGEEGERGRSKGGAARGYLSKNGSENGDEEEEGGGDGDEDNFSTIFEQKSKPSFVKRLRNSVKEIFSRSSSKEISAK
jgi:hypothetical protein